MKDYTILGRVVSGLGIAYDKDAGVACATEMGYTYALTTFQKCLYDYRQVQRC